MNSDRKITINNSQTIAILNRAKNWIGTITPPAVLSFQEEESRVVFQTANALFMRNWFFAYGLANEDNSPIKGLVGISSIPAGDAGRGAGTNGAWLIGISRYSKHPQETFEFLQFLMDYENSLRRGVSTSEFPPYRAAYKDESFLEDVPAIKFLGSVFDSAVSRPSTVTAPNYNAVSTRISRGVHEILAGRSETEDGLAEIAFDTQEITGFEIAN